MLLDPITRVEHYLYEIITGASPARDPITREEHYLSAILGVGDAPSPITRIEYYLSKIAGQDVDTPTPVTRIEFFLAKKAGLEVEVPTPITRLEHYLAEWIEAAPSGYDVTASGTLPLTLAHSLAANIISLVRTGAMTQTPAPTPDAPVYPSINNGTVRYGALTSNLYDPDPAFVELGYYRNSSGGKAVSRANFLMTKNTPIEAGKSYVFYGRKKDGGALAEYCRIYWFDANGEYLSTGPYVQNTVTVATAPANAAFAQFGVNESGTSGATVTQAIVDSYNWYFGEGTEEPEAFVPYEAGIYTDGEETLTVGGNLLSRDGETTGKITNADGTVSDNANYCISAPFVLPAGNYTCTWNYGSAGTRPFSVFACDADGTPKTDGRLFYQARAAADINTGEFTVEAKTLVVASYRSNATDLTIYSHTQTAIVPNLFAVGDYKDEVDVVAGQKPRRVGCHIFDGTEAFTLSGGAFRTVALEDKAANTKVVCSHFNGDVAPTMAVSTMPDLSVKGYGPNEAIFFKYSAITTVADFKAYLADQYAQGAPVIVWYPLATPVTESIAPQALRTVDGTTIVSSSAGSVGATVEYRASEQPAGLFAASPTPQSNEEVVNNPAPQEESEDDNNDSENP